MAAIKKRKKAKPEPKKVLTPYERAMPFSCCGWVEAKGYTRTPLPLDCAALTESETAVCSSSGEHARAKESATPVANLSDAGLHTRRPTGNFEDIEGKDRNLTTQI